MRRKLRHLVLSSLAAAALLVAGSLPAHAVQIVRQDFQTLITFAGPANPFGVNVGDVFPSTAFYDLDLLTPVPTFQSPLTDPNLSLTVNVGSLSLPGSFDDLFPIFPELLLDSVSGLQEMNFVVSGFDFPPATVNSLGQFTFQSLPLGSSPQPFDIFDNSFSGADVSGVFIIPDTFFTPAQNVVPEPGSMLLLGSGLLGLAGYGRKRMRK